MLLLCFVTIVAARSLFHRATRARGITVEIGRTCVAGGREESARIIVIELRSDGTALANDEAIAEDQIAARMAEVYRDRGDNRLLRLVAANEVDYGRVVRLIAQVQQASPTLEVMILRDEPEEQMDLHFCSARWPGYTVRHNTAPVQ